MIRRRPLKREPQDVLVRSPWLAERSNPPIPVINVIDQLEELAALLARGLMSREEFERQKRKVLYD